MKKNLIIGLVLALIGAAAGARYYLPQQAEKQRNRVLAVKKIPVSSSVRTLHQRLLVADLHADSLLWNRDLAQRADYGHLDLPRMRAGNLSLQVFTIVTQTPRGLNLKRNTGETDEIRLLSLAQGLPVSTWFSLSERVLHHSKRLHALAAQAENNFMLIKNRADLNSFIKKKKDNPRLTAGLIGIEGAHALEGNLHNIDRFFDAGVRLVGLAHFFDTDISGSAHGVKKGGLTRLGRRALARMQQKGMVIDLAHSSAAAIDDVLAHSSRPVIVSHTGVKRTCNNIRNLSDRQLKKIAASGGIIGIGFWSTAVCGKDVQAIIKAIRHTAGVVGIDHVALGSDFDGAVTLPFDASGMSQITQGLVNAGFSTGDIEKIMGRNVVRVLKQILPQ